MSSLLNTIQAMDLRLFSRMQHHQSWLAKHCRGISRTADGQLYGLAAITSFLMNFGGDQTFALLLCLCFAVERPIYYVLKNTCRRRRPPQAIPGFKSQVVAADKFSFPSGHTSAAFMFSVSCLLCFGPVAAPLLIWAGMVGFSRIFLGVHFPTDVLIGACMGSVLALYIHSTLI